MSSESSIYSFLVFSTSTHRTWDVYDPLLKTWFIAIIINMNRWILNYFQNYFHPCKSPLPNILIWISAFTSVLCIYNSSFYMPCFMVVLFLYRINRNSLLHYPSTLWDQFCLWSVSFGRSILFGGDERELFSVLGSKGRGLWYLDNSWYDTWKQ